METSASVEKLTEWSGEFSVLAPSKYHLEASPLQVNSSALRRKSKTSISPIRDPAGFQERRGFRKSITLKQTETGS